MKTSAGPLMSLHGAITATGIFNIGACHPSACSRRATTAKARHKFARARPASRATKRVRHGVAAHLDEGIHVSELHTVVSVVNFNVFRFIRRVQILTSSVATDGLLRTQPLRIGAISVSSFCTSLTNSKKF